MLVAAISTFSADVGGVALNVQKGEVFESSEAVVAAHPAMFKGTSAGVLSVPVVIPLTGTTLTWSNMPAADTEFPNLYRTKVDLTKATDARLVVRVGVQGTTNSDLRAQYSADQSSWANLTGEAATNGVGTIATPWAAIPTGAKGDVFVRVMGKEGDGAVDPQFRLIQLQVR